MKNIPSWHDTGDTERDLLNLVHHYLFEAPSWPMDPASLPAFYALLERLGLQEEVAGKVGATQYTCRGIELEVELITCLVGAHEITEIPMLLAERGLIDEQEADEFYATLEQMDDRTYTDKVETLVIKAYRAWRRLKGAGSCRFARKWSVTPNE